MVLALMMFAVVVGSAVAQAPRASLAASPNKSLAPAVSPSKSGTALTPSAVVKSSISAPRTLPTAAPAASPPSLPTAATPASGPSTSATPLSSVTANPSGAPTSTRANSGALNRVTIVGSAGVAFLAAALLF